MLASLAGNATIFSEDVVTLDDRQWTADSNGEPIKLSEANAFCNRLELGGHSDWQMPKLDQLKLLKYDNIVSNKYKTNFDLKIEANKKFEDEINNYSFNWRSGGQFSKRKIDKIN